jgi:hypothetical protein
MKILKQTAIITLLIYSQSILALSAAGVAQRKDRITQLQQKKALTAEERAERNALMKELKTDKNSAKLVKTLAAQNAKQDLAIAQTEARKVAQAASTAQAEITTLSVPQTTKDTLNNMLKNMQTKATKIATTKTIAQIQEETAQLDNDLDGFSSIFDTLPVADQTALSPASNSITTAIATITQVTTPAEAPTSQGDITALSGGTSSTSSSPASPAFVYDAATKAELTKSAPEQGDIASGLNALAATDTLETVYPEILASLGNLNISFARNRNQYILTKDKALYDTTEQQLMVIRNALEAKFNAINAAQNPPITDAKSLAAYVEAQKTKGNWFQRFAARIAPAPGSIAGNFFNMLDLKDLYNRINQALTPLPADKQALFDERVYIEGVSQDVDAKLQNLRKKENDDIKAGSTTGTYKVSFMPRGTLALSKIQGIEDEIKSTPAGETIKLKYLKLAQKIWARKGASGYNNTRYANLATDEKKEKVYKLVEDLHKYADLGSFSGAYANDNGYGIVPATTYEDSMFRGNFKANPTFEAFKESVSNMAAAFAYEANKYAQEKMVETQAYATDLVQRATPIIVDAKALIDQAITDAGIAAQPRIAQAIELVAQAQAASTAAYQYADTKLKEAQQAGKALINKATGADAQKAMATASQAIQEAKDAQAEADKKAEELAQKEAALAQEAAAAAQKALQEAAQQDAATKEAAAQAVADAKAAKDALDDARAAERMAQQAQRDAELLKTKAVTFAFSENMNKPGFLNQNQSYSPYAAMKEYFFTTPVVEAAAPAISTDWMSADDYKEWSNAYDTDMQKENDRYSQAYDGAF